MAFKFNPFTGTLDIVGTGSGGSSNSFTIIQTDAGTSPTATSPTDTLTFTSSDSSILITGDSSNDTVDFVINPDIAQYENVVPLVDGVSIATDASLGNIFTVTIAGNRTLSNPTNPVNGQKCIWRIRQDATGGRTLTLGSDFRFGTDVTVLNLSLAANKTDYIGAIYNSTDSKWDILAISTGY